jgi:hypothetical protein
MRLKEIKEIIDAVIPRLIIDAQTVTINGSPYMSFKKIQAFRMALNDLAKTALFKQTIDEIISDPVIQTTTNEIIANVNEGKLLVTKITNLESTARNISEALAPIVKEVKENTIYIKLADTRDFQDLANTAESFNKILSQTILDEEVGGQVNIQTVENGSIWLEVYLGSIKAVSVIGSIALSAAIAFREYKKGLYISESTRTRKLTNDKLEALQNAHKLLLDDLIDSEAAYIDSKHFEKSDPERIERIKLSIKMLSEEMDKGAEIQPSKKIPQEIAIEFPDMKNLPMLTSKIKEIKGE